MTKLSIIIPIYKVEKYIEVRSNKILQKVEIDEIRVAATFADVTPAGTGIFSSASKSNAYVHCSGENRN